MLDPGDEVIHQGCFVRSPAVAKKKKKKTSGMRGQPRELTKNLVLLISDRPLLTLVDLDLVEILFAFFFFSIDWF